MTVALHRPRPLTPPSARGMRLQHDQLDDALSLEQAGPSSWRVCDGRIARGQGRFLAFIDRKGDTFEVMQIANDFVWASFPTMRAALDHVVETYSARLSEGSAGQLDWLKRDISDRPRPVLP